MRAPQATCLLPFLLLAPNSVPARPTPALVGEATIYRDRNFNGPAVTIPHDEANMRLVWTVDSVRVRSGTWQLCERPNFQGSCLTVSADKSSLGHRHVQSARLVGPNLGPAPGPGVGWHTLNTTDVNRFGWNHRVILAPGNPRLSAVRLCAERNRIRLHDARARFANSRFQPLHVPSQLGGGSCTAPQLLHGGRNLSSVEVTASTTALAAKGRIRLEGR